MSRLKTTILILGDILMLYATLVLTLIIRYGKSMFGESFNSHFLPFSLIFIIWIVIFYLLDLHKDKFLRANLETAQNLALGVVISAATSATFFYLFPELFKLTPKTNLAIFGLVFGLLDFFWRFILAKIYISGGWRNKLLIIGDSPIIKETVDYLKNNPQVGYDVTVQIKEYSGQKTEDEINRLINAQTINTIIIQHHLKRNPEFAKIVYQLLVSKIAVIDLIAFYETVFQKAPIEELDESWFIEKITTRRHLYDIAKRILDVIFSIIAGVIFSPAILISAILTKLSPRKGPVIFKHKRMGINNDLFVLYKFGIMKEDKGPPWTAENDDRFTTIGKFLSYTHLNETPQIWNILKGDISFIGPRPESKDLVELYQQIPYYKIRHIIKPGLTGWAQVNYKASASIEEAQEKLKYDIYYIKNRSLIIDFLILLKTVKYLFRSLK